ncbi:MAG: hemolysin family protein [Ignavibacterium sp.]|jgi:putative hemolysin|nr:hemolysin family protein [Ignavibacterium sp.]
MELVLVFLLLLFINFILAASEIALASFGESKIEELKQKQDKDVPYFEELNKNEEQVYSSIQLTSKFLIVIISVLGYLIFSNWIYNQALTLTGFYNYLDTAITIVITSIVITIIILVFNVLVPKAIAYRYSDSIGKKSIKIILIISKALKFITSGITAISNLILLPFKEKINFSQERPTEDEILDIISDGVKSGTIDEADQEIIENIFEFNDLKADEVMIPRTEMIAVNLNEENEKNINLIIKSGHTLVPVYENSLDNIVGILHTKDLMRAIIEKRNLNLKSLIRPACFVPETKLISEILKDMQKQGEKIAIVTDEYGGTEGVVTIEDILEEIVGEIKDKTQSEIQSYSKLPDGKFYVLGSMFIDEFNDTFNFKLDESDEYNTIAGFVADKSGKILDVGEKFEFDGLIFELIKKIRQKMVQFRVYDEAGNFSLSSQVELS